MMFAAGANSVLYSSGDFDWMFYFLVVFASIISVAPAVVINNMSKKRQYPTYWGYAPSFVASKLSAKIRPWQRKKKIGGNKIS
mmetsp:Transcript_46717/g.69085  ORF Transcript_46717/g.69085 Transcript_46717/m.69085 type:complete len:83 (+) Transcript_46717:1887-2135(+)